MKKMFIAVLVVVLTLSILSGAYASSFELVEIGLTQQIGYTTDVWLENDVMRALLVTAIGIDVMTAELHNLWGSDLDFAKAYTGRSDNAVVVNIPTVKKDECLIVMYAPNDPYGVYRIIHNNFTDALMLSMAKSVMQDYAKVDEDILQEAINTLLGQI